MDSSAAAKLGTLVLLPFPGCEGEAERCVDGQFPHATLPVGGTPPTELVGCSAVVVYSSYIWVHLSALLHTLRELKPPRVVLVSTAASANQHLAALHCLQPLQRLAGIMARIATPSCAQEDVEGDTLPPALALAALQRLHVMHVPGLTAATPATLPSPAGALSVLPLPASAQDLPRPLAVSDLPSEADAPPPQHVGEVDSSDMPRPWRQRLRLAASWVAATLPEPGMQPVFALGRSSSLLGHVVASEQEAAAAAAPVATLPAAVAAAVAESGQEALLGTWPGFNSLRLALVHSARELLEGMGQELAREVEDIAAEAVADAPQPKPAEAGGAILLLDRTWDPAGAAGALEPPCLPAAVARHRALHCSFQAAVRHSTPADMPAVGDTAPTLLDVLKAADTSLPAAAALFHAIALGLGWGHRPAQPPSAAWAAAAAHMQRLDTPTGAQALLLLLQGLRGEAHAHAAAACDVYVQLCPSRRAVLAVRTTPGEEGVCVPLASLYSAASALQPHAERRQAALDLLCAAAAVAGGILDPDVHAAVSMAAGAVVALLHVPCWAHPVPQQPALQQQLLQGWEALREPSTAARATLPTLPAMVGLAAEGDSVAPLPDLAALLAPGSAEQGVSLSEALVLAEEAYAQLGPVAALQRAAGEHGSKAVPLPPALAPALVGPGTPLVGEEALVLAVADALARHPAPLQLLAQGVLLPSEVQPARGLDTCLDKGAVHRATVRLVRRVREAGSARLLPALAGGTPHPLGAVHGPMPPLDGSCAPQDLLACPRVLGRVLGAVALGRRIVSNPASAQDVPTRTLHAAVCTLSHVLDNRCGSVLDAVQQAASDAAGRVLGGLTSLGAWGGTALGSLLGGRGGGTTSTAEDKARQAALKKLVQCVQRLGAEGPVTVLCLGGLVPAEWAILGAVDVPVRVVPVPPPSTPPALALRAL